MPNICMSFAVPPWLVAMDVLRLLVDVASSAVVTRTMIEQAGSQAGGSICEAINLLETKNE